jgi:hypothetical protein
MSRIFKPVVLALCIVFSAPALTATQSVECTDEEVGFYLSDEGLIDRASLSDLSYKDYQAAYVTLQQEKDPSSCIAAFIGALDPSAAFKEIMDLVNSMPSTSADLITGLYNQVLAKLNEELDKTLCERIPALATGFLAAQKEAINSRLSDIKGLAKDKTNDYLGDSNIDAWINGQVNHTFGDTEGILTWRNGTDGKLDVSGDARKWENVLDGLFD